MNLFGEKSGKDYLLSDSLHSKWKGLEKEDSQAMFSGGDCIRSRVK